ncbi:MAG: LON peptidase substrate-binding domain-containing protein, partial [Alistipes sp.]|nr:LON peptidase substrate-binding domain-containing protein [Alistipes sp.]
MKKEDNDILFDEKGFSTELADRKFQAIPIVSGDDDTIEDVKLPEILPILTLRNSVLFPGAVTPITVGREKSIALVRAVNSGDGLLGAVLQRNPEIETPTPDDMYRIGTAARILKILEMPNGNLTVILSGLEKIEVGEYIS